MQMQNPNTLPANRDKAVDIYNEIKAITWKGRELKLIIN